MNYFRAIHWDPGWAWYLSWGRIHHEPDLLGQRQVLRVPIGQARLMFVLIGCSPEPPQYIFWYHDEEPISYSSVRGGISQITEKGPVTASYLLIQEARMQDSGEYACKASVGNISYVTVHVFKSMYHITFHRIML